MQAFHHGSCAARACPQGIPHARRVAGGSQTDARPAAHTARSAKCYLSLPCRYPARLSVLGTKRRNFHCIHDVVRRALAEQSVQDVKTSVARLATAMRDHKLNGRVKQLDAKELKTSILAQQAAAEFEEDKVVKRRWQPSLERSPIKYETQQTVAYVAARLPSVYAAVHRVLSEVCAFSLTPVHLPLHQFECFL